MDTFKQWLEMRYKEMLEARARYTLDGKEEDDMFEWYLSHAAVLGEVYHQLKVVLASIENGKAKSDNI